MTNMTDIVIPSGVQPSDEAKERAFHFGSALIEKGFKPGQETYNGIYSQNRTEWALTDLACSSFSMIGVSLYDSLGVDSSQIIKNTAEVGVVVCDTIKKAESLLKLKEDNAVPTLKLLVVMEPLSEEQVNGAKEKGVELVTFQEVVEFGKEHEKDLMIPIKDEIYSVCFTSGTAGDPKSAQLSHGNRIANITATYLNVKVGMSLSPSDRYLSYLPLTHMLERCCQAINIVCGVQIGFFHGDIRKFADDFDILKPTLFINVPRLLNRFYDKQLYDDGNDDDDDDELSSDGRVSPLSSTLITGMVSQSNVSVEDTIPTKDTPEHEKQRYYVEVDEDENKGSSVDGPEENDDKGPVEEDIEEGKGAPEPPPSIEKPIPQRSFVDDETFGDGDPPDDKKYQMKKIEVNLQAVGDEYSSLASQMNLQKWQDYHQSHSTFQSNSILANNNEGAFQSETMVVKMPELSTDKVIANYAEKKGPAIASGSSKYAPTQPLEDFHKATEKFSPAVNAKKPVLKKQTTESVSQTKPSMDQKSTKVNVPGELMADVKIRNALNESSSSQGVHLDSDVDLPGPSRDQKEVERESQVHDHVAKTTQLSSDTRKTSYGYQNPKTQKKTSYGYQNPKTQIKLIILLLLSLGICVSADETCNRVLIASEVESRTSRLLRFHQGQYKAIEEGAFANAEEAERLDISNNCLQNVPDDVFDNMTDLFDIDISYNKFSDFPPALQRPDSLKKLSHLNFMCNSIHYLGKDFFKGKEEISKINFDYNRIEIIHNTALNHLPALMIATFLGNVLTALPQLNVTQLENLSYIDVRNNTLQSLKIEHFSNFAEVTNITITNEIMSLIIGTEREVVFWIDGNSKTISCEENEQEIQKSKVPINYTFSCQYRNGSQHQLKGIKLPQNDYTTVMSDVVSHPTPLSFTNDECPTDVGLWICSGLSLSVNVCIAVIVIVLYWKGFVCRRSRSTCEGKKVGEEVKNGPTCEEGNELMSTSKA